MSNCKKSVQTWGESRNVFELPDPSHSVPSRWWRSASPFPVMAGTLCAIAIMFNICTVSQGWQETENADGSITILSQQTWMVALKAISLALAALSYITLILTMMCKRNPQQGFIVTISGWLIAGALLFSLIGVNARRHPIIQSRQPWKYTQSYFYGIMAAGLYTLIAILLAVYTATARSVPLSRHDRRIVEYTSIILRTITFIAFLTGGAGVYSAVEGWSFMDAVYFTDYTVLTIGIGNIVPKTHLGRSLLFPYATAGIITLGLVISSIQSFGNSIRHMKLKFEIQEARNKLLEQKRPTQYEHNDSRTLCSIPSTTTFPQTSDVVELQRIRYDFNQRVRWMALIFFVVAWFVLWLLSAAVFRRSERGQNWTYFTALYFTYTSLTTIGYGDFYPTSNFGKVFFVFWSLLAIPVLTNLVTAMGEIGVRTLVYFAGYILRLGKMRRKSGHGMKNCSDTEPLGNCRDVEKHAEWSSKLRKPSQDISTPGTRSTLTTNELELSLSMNKAGRHGLLLAEEIKKLVIALMNGSNEQDPRHDWPFVLALLHSGHDEAHGSMEHIFPGVMNEYTSYASGALSSEERTATERNNETLLMLKLLADKLCLDLRRGQDQVNPSE